MKDDITKLTELWYKLVGLDHHKDRDCHWYINTVYSYGEPPVYRVEHYGYIWTDVQRSCPSYEEAEAELYDEINLAIASEKQWAEKVLASDPSKKNWDEDQIERANGILKLLKSSTPQRKSKCCKELSGNKRVWCPLDCCKVEQILSDYTSWLCKHRYTDADVYAEEPTAVEGFLKERPDLLTPKKKNV